MATKPPDDFVRLALAWANLQRLVNTDIPALVGRIIKAWASLPW